MGKFIDLTDKKYDRLIVVECIKNENKRNKWLCNCVCGKSVIVLGYNLRNGHTKSCGCLALELRTKHGHYVNNNRSFTNITWRNMIKRCRNSKDKEYKNYGGRGIKVCKRWLKFENFLEDMGERPNELTLDRIDNNGNYCKENCRWATHKEQSRNTRTNKIIIYNGKRQPLIEWCEELCLDYDIVQNRITKYKWSVDRAFTQKPRIREKNK